MKMDFNHPELILPAGNFEKLKYALAYGADAVYAGPPDCSLRARLNEFDLSTLKEAITYTRKKNKKIYITLNIFARDYDFKKIEMYIRELEGFNPAAFIVSDPWIIRFLNKIKVTIPLHLSTQANTLNSESVRFWEDYGIKRVILARELSYDEIARIRDTCRDVELEIFVHGAMCMAYSGRCLLSLYFTERDGNRGDCSHTCRWKYYIMEEKRPFDPLVVEEDEKGSYILSSRDLCLINHLDRLKNLRLDGYKIEGRTKNIFYVAITAKAYRMALDMLYGRSSHEPIIDPFSLIMLLDNHGFTTGFIFKGQNVVDLGDCKLQNPFERQDKKQQIVGFIREADSTSILVEAKNPLRKGEEVIAITPRTVTELKILSLREGAEEIDVAYGAKRQVVKAIVDKETYGDEWKLGILIRKSGNPVLNLR